MTHRVYSCCSASLVFSSHSWCFFHIYCILVDGLEHEFYFSIYWEFHHPNWLSYFSEGLKPPTSVFFSTSMLVSRRELDPQLRWVWSMPGTKRSRTLATTLTPLPSSRARDISPRWSGKDGVTESILCGMIPRAFHQWRYPNSWKILLSYCKSYCKWMMNRGNLHTGTWIEGFQRWTCHCHLCCRKQAGWHGLIWRWAFLRRELLSGTLVLLWGREQPKVSFCKWLGV